VGDPIKDIDETVPWMAAWDVAFRMEVWSFCSAVRQGTPLLCGPQRAFASAAVALAGNKAIATKTRVEISPV
jgi:predicted dehydrogenase